MASTSSQPLVGCGKYEVFINHRGIDVKHTLASCIYCALYCSGVRAFLDKEKLEAGEKIDDAIKEAISEALVHIAIFSPKYAQSRWCLDELTLMLQTGRKIVPIFYHIEPSHLRWVRHGRGDYAEAFSKHEKDGRYTPKQLEEWKEALIKASDISDFEVKERENDLGHLVQQIVNIVKNVMKEKNMPLLHVATHAVGLDEAMEKFQNFVETRSQCAHSIENVKIVGIVGIGGSGKTTIVKEYFNKKRSYYTESSFLPYVRDAAANNRLHDLQKKLLKDLLHSEEAIHHESEGKGTLEHRVRSVKALIVLDDVDHIDQIENLTPFKGNLHPDSLIIITTRDYGVIESSASLSLSVSCYVYKIGRLDPVHAKQLFCLHAFLQDFPVKGFEGLVEEFLKACQGLPLYLKVLGSNLYGKCENYWKSQLHKISKTLPEDVNQRLKMSYDALDEEQQQIFLDIACFFIGEQKDRAISIWDGSGGDGFLWSGWHGFQILESKCLVEVDHKNYIRMHDHLRDLGREIAIEKTPSRFWSHSQFVNSKRPLEERLPMRGIMAATGSRYGSCNLHYEPPFEECMQLLMGQSTSRSRSRTPFALGLQLLVVSGDYFKEEFAKLSEELVWLRWYGFPHEKLPSWLSMEKLRVLELYEPKTLVELWGPNDAPPSQLRELIIKYSASTSRLRMIPETIGFLKHLEKMVLNNTELSSLPEEFCLLESLEHLELSQSHLSSLPTHFGNLRKLKYLNLYNCSELTALPLSFNQLTELQYLNLQSCRNLHIQKDILKNIRKLEKLDLGYCYKLQQLPTEITRQVYLRERCLPGAGLRELPDDIDKLANLEVLVLDGWKLNVSSLKVLTRIWCLTRLKHLELSSLDVEYLPEGFGKLVNLQKLEIHSCPIRELPLANPEERYSKKTRLFPCLKRIFLTHTKVSTIFIPQDCCPCLEDLTLSWNEDLMEIETLPTKLKRLEIWRCKKLENIRVVAGLAELEVLRINECSGLDELPSFAGLVKLRVCLVDKCPEIDELPTFACCTCLEYLSINVSNRLMKIEGIEELRSLNRLRLETSWKEPGIKSLKNLDKLTSLQIWAERRSAIETCIPPNIVKRGCEMEIVGMAVEDVESVVGSLSFPNLTLVEKKLHRPSNRHGGAWWVMETPLSTASCVIGCFVISCCSEAGSIYCGVGPAGNRFLNPIPFLKLKEKQVYIRVWPKGFQLNEEETEFLTVTTDGDAQIEKGMAVIMRNGEEEKTLETLHKFLELLER